MTAVPAGFDSAHRPHFVCQALPLDPSAQAHYSEVLRRQGIQDPLEALARAIAASPGWPQEAGPVLVVRASASPHLAAFGHFDDAAAAGLQAQAHALSPACRRLRYIGFPDIQQNCETLARLLLERFGAAGLERSRFTAIPRGGLVVLGLLAAALGLRHDQLITPAAADPDETLIVIDDCALTGARLGGFLEDCRSRDVVFACLYSPPALRSAVTAREPRVSACLSAADLEGEEFSPEVVASFPEEPGIRRFWYGLPETLCLPWNEPDRLVWNPVRDGYEPAWRIVPPELCLKNRPMPGSPPVPIQVLPAPRGPLRPRDSVLYAEYEGNIVIGDLEAGRSFRLAGSGSGIWKAVVQEGTVEGAAAVLAREYDVPMERLLQDLHRLVPELLSQGLLEQA